MFKKTLDMPNKIYQVNILVSIIFLHSQVSLLLQAESIQIDITRKLLVYIGSITNIYSMCHGVRGQHINKQRHITEGKSSELLF